MLVDVFQKFHPSNGTPGDTSQFEDIKELQTATDTKKKITTIYKGKEFNIKNQFYFSTGEWSLASMAKKLGPFEFSIDKYDFDFKNELLTMSVNRSLQASSISRMTSSASSGVLVSGR